MSEPTEREYLEGMTFQSEAEYVLPEPDDVPWPAQDFASEISLNQVRGISESKRCATCGHRRSHHKLCIFARCDACGYDPNW